MKITCFVLIKLIMWTFGILSFFAGLMTWIWWPFVTIVTAFMHLQVPVPLGFVPPIYDGTIGAFIVKGSFIVGTVSLILGLIFDQPLWMIPAFLCFWKRFVLRYEAHETIERFRRLSPSIEWDESRSHPPLPLVLYIHPYLLHYIGHWDLGGGVRIRRIEPDSTNHKPTNTGSNQYTTQTKFNLTTSFDLWYVSSTDPSSSMSSHPKKPLFFFIHGGGWIFGESRRHTQVLTLQRLALQGYVVIAVNYRKFQWPQHVDDSYNTLRYVMQEAERFGIDTSRITVSGASAGGQIAALLQLRLQNDVDRMLTAGVSKSALPPKLQGMVLYYPVTDPADDCQATFRIPFALPFIAYKPWQSFMHWFFEFYALKGVETLLHGASPLRLLVEENSGPSAASSWPPTLILAGDLDGIVPNEGNVKLLNILESHRRRAMVVVNTAGLGLGTSSSPGANGGGNAGVGDVLTHPYNAYSPLLEQSLPTSVNRPVSSSAGVYTGFPAATTTTKNGSGNSSYSIHGSTLPLSGAEAGIGSGSQWNVTNGHASSTVGMDHVDHTFHRPQDSLLVVPGSKHIFEAGGGMIVEVTCDGVIAWLKEHTHNCSHHRHR